MHIVQNNYLDVHTDIFHSLAELDRVTQHALEQVNLGIREQQGRVDQLSGRLDAVTIKLSQLSKTRKPITIRSRHRHPDELHTESARPEFHSGFPVSPLQDEPVSCLPHEFSWKHHDLFDASLMDGLLELKRDAPTSAAYRSGQPHEHHRAMSLNNLLVFKSNELVFQRAAGLDVEDGATTDNDDEVSSEHDQRVVLHDAPSSLVHGGKFQDDDDGFNVTFQPKAKAPKPLNLPSNLDLPDIADLSFPNTPSVTVEPSNALTSGLTQGTLGSRGEDERVGGEEKTDRRVAKKPMLPPLNSDLDASAPSTISASTNTSPPKAASATHGDGADNVGTCPPETVNRRPSPPGAGDRGSLLASIRKMGSSKKILLKPVSEAAPPAAQTSPGAPLSLADEMKQKLARRQKAISGERDEEEQAIAARRRSSLLAPVRAVSVVGKMKATMLRHATTSEGEFGGVEEDGDSDSFGDIGSVSSASPSRKKISSAAATHAPRLSLSVDGLSNLLDKKSEVLLHSTMGNHHNDHGDSDEWDSS